MSELSDNAVAFDMDMNSKSAVQPHEQQFEVEHDADGVASEIKKLMNNFADFTLQSTLAENMCSHQAIAHDQKLSAHILEEKMRMLCDLNSPIGNKMYTVAHVNNMHKELLEQFHKLYNSETECVSAYAAHCKEAIKAKEALGQTNDFDEYTDMSYITLMEITAKVKMDHSETEAATLDKISKLKQKGKDNDAKYKSLLKESEIFGQYQQEAMETLEQQKFEGKMRPRALNMKKFD